MRFLLNLRDRCANDNAECLRRVIKALRRLRRHSSLPGRILSTRLDIIRAQDYPLPRPNAPEHRDNLRIEMFARLLADNAQRLAISGGISIWPVGRQCVESIGYGEKPGAQGDVLSLESLRVA